MCWRPSVVLVALIVLLGSARGAAADEAWPRWYWGTRLGWGVIVDTEAIPDVPTTRRQQATGMSLGVDLGRHLSVELAADVFETELRYRPLGRIIGEFGQLTLIPQARVRYPLAGGGITPYALLGVGISHGEFNDRKKPGFGVPVDAAGTSVVGAVGGGVEYTIADGLAIGAEVRYLISRGHEIAVAGQRHDANLDMVLAAFTLRVGGPLATTDTTPAPDPVARGHYYLTLRLGGATPLRTRIARGIAAEPENAAIGGVFDHVFGVGLGLDVWPRLGFELAADGFEPILSMPGFGAVGEYGVYAVVPQIRGRAPVLDGRLVAYLLAGVGVSYAEFNDRKPPGFITGVSGRDFGIALATGLGLEYFVTDRVAFGVEAKYQAMRGHELEVGRDTRSVDLDVVIAAVAARIYFGPAR